MVEAGHASDEELKDQSFIELPAILDKYKAAALIADGKSTQAPFHITHTQITV